MHIAMGQTMSLALSPSTPARSPRATVRGSTHCRDKVAYLLPTRSRCLNRLYSLSLFTGSLQDLQRQYLHGVPHNNKSTGRSCWYGRNSLFSAESPPMRLARDMPQDWQISNESRTLLSTTSRRPWGRGAGSCKPRHTQVLLA
jgi:hypothetical protein